MLLGRYRQQPYDRRKRGIDFTDFLEDDEEIAQIVSVAITPATSPPFVVDGTVIDSEGKKIAYYGGGGVENTEYTAAFKTRTSLNQYRQDEVQFDIEGDV